MSSTRIFSEGSVSAPGLKAKSRQAPSLSLNTLVIAAGRVLSVAGLILLESLLAGRLTNEAFGSYLVHFSAATALSMVFTMGLHRAIPRDLKRFLPKAEIQSAIASVGNATWVLCVLFPGLTITLSVAVQWFTNPVLTSVVVLSAGLALQQVVAETLRGLDRVKTASFYAGPAGGPLFVAVALLSMAFPTHMISTLVQVFQIQCLIAWMVLIPGLFSITLAFKDTMKVEPNSNVRFRISRPIGTVLVDYLSLMVAQATFYTGTQVDLWIAPFLMTDQQVASYASPRRLVMLTSAPLQLMNILVVSRIPELLALGKPQKLQKLLRKTAVYGFAPGALVLLVFVCFPQTVLTAIYGSRYSGGAAVLQILAIAQMFNAWTGSCGLTLMMSGRQRIALVTNLAAAGSLLATAWLAGLDAPIHLAWLAAAVIIAQYAFLWLLTWKLVGVRTDAGIGAVLFQSRDGQPTTSVTV